MDRERAVSECAKTEALLAEIHDRTQENALCDFVASKLSSEVYYVRLWVGMDYMTWVSNLQLFGTCR